MGPLLFDRGVPVLNLHRLRLLVELRNRGTIAAAAQALGYSPSAVSQQLTRLEREAGAPLTTAVGRGLALTPQGNLLADHAERLLLEAERAETALAQWSGEARGLLRVAMMWTLTATIGPELITGLQERHPHLDLRMREVSPEGAVSALAAHEVDVLVCEETLLTDRADSGIHYETVMVEQMLLAVPAQWGELDVADIAQRPWAASRGGVTRPRIEELCRAHGQTARINFEADHPLVLLRLVESGVAAALLPATLADAESPAVQCRSLDDGTNRTIVAACRAGSRYHPAVLACFAELNSVLGQ